MRELRLTEAIHEPHICENILQYNVHAERKGSLRYAKGMSETMQTLHGLVYVCQPSLDIVSYANYGCILLKVNGKGKGFPYSIPSVGPGADPGVQSVSLQVTVSHPPGGRLPLLSAWPAVTSPAAEHHRPLASTKLYCLVTEAHRYKQLA